MKAWGITDIGLQRRENQDNFAIGNGAADGQIIAVVCDGMGGANAGQLASSIAVHTFMGELTKLLTPDMTTVQLREAASFCVSRANAAVYERAKQEPALHGMGTTLVCAVTCGSDVVICNVGDSRAYKITKETIERITHDHSVVEGLIERGDITAEEARTHPNRNLITRALGPELSTECDVFTTQLAANESILLCSDGLVVTVTDEEMHRVVCEAESVSQGLERLLAISRENGAPDNVTALLVCNL